MFASLYMSQEIVKVWMVKFGKPPVIHRIGQGFPPPKIHAIWYIILDFDAIKSIGYNNE